AVSANEQPESRGH
nr:immunoglobulin heavy chain junction region [Homo sapiens]